MLNSVRADFTLSKEAFQNIVYTSKLIKVRYNVNEFVVDKDEDVQCLFEEAER